MWVSLTEEDTDQYTVYWKCSFAIVCWLLEHYRWACYTHHEENCCCWTIATWCLSLLEIQLKQMALTRHFKKNSYYELWTMGCSFVLGFFLTTIFPHKVGFLCGEVFYLGYGWPPAQKKQVHWSCSWWIFLLAHPKIAILCLCSGYNLSY